MFVRFEKIRTLHKNGIEWLYDTFSLINIDNVKMITHTGFSSWTELTFVDGKEIQVYMGFNELEKLICPIKYLNGEVIN